MQEQTGIWMPPESAKPELAFAHIDYRTFEDERYPSIGVYYMFRKSSGLGICRRFEIDVTGCARFGSQVVLPKTSYEFKSETRLLAMLEQETVQGSICLAF